MEMTEAYVPKYLSPSSISTYHDSPEKYYLTYKTEWGKTRRGKSVGPAMSLGSAFDQMIKRDIADMMDGRVVSEGGYAFKDIVDPVAEAVYSFYLTSGAYGALLADLVQGTPVMEETVKETVGGVPFYGKPDLWVRRRGVIVILDWKVSGWFGMDKMLKPAAAQFLSGDVDGMRAGSVGSVGGGYVREFGLQGRGQSVLDSTTCGVPLGPAKSVKKWIHQLCIYAWMKGCPVGTEDWLVCVDALFPGRIVQYRTRVPAAYQEALLAFCKEMWAVVSSPDWTMPKLDRMIELGLSGVDVAFESLEGTMDFWSGRGVLEGALVL